MSPDARDYDALTFDCYGTLIDWGKGLVDHLQPLLLRQDAHVIDDFVLEFFAEAEPHAQTPGKRYADVLREVLKQLGARLGFTPTADMLDAFAASPGEWPPFPDTARTLQRLGERFELAIVSNIDNALFAKTAQKLGGVVFKHVVTAQDVGVYKPDPRMFEAAREALGDARVLHVAQSAYHDIVPAAALGLDTALIDRANNAARRADTVPTWRFDSLTAFADAILS